MAFGGSGLKAQAQSLPLPENAAVCLISGPKSFRETVSLDEQRKVLLQVARIDKVATLCFHLKRLANTVVPRVLKNALTVLVLITYAITAFVVRNRHWDISSIDLDLIESQGMSTLVTFMIIFYVGYCYDRHYAQYLEANKGRNALVDCCAMAGAYMTDERDSHKLWRYLNLAHVLAFVGLSPTYTADNLLHGFIKEHSLDISREELQQLKVIGVEAGQGAYLQSVQWALSLISEASEGDHTESRHVHFMKVHSMQNEILLFRRSMAALYAYHFQVIPYVYTHMISLVSALYLCSYAVLKGTAFAPGTSVALGLVFPLLSLVLVTISCIGLIEVGSTLANPWGGELEDFAVFHFVDSACVHTRSMVASSQSEDHRKKLKERRRSMAELGASVVGINRATKAVSGMCAGLTGGACLTEGTSRSSGPRVQLVEADAGDLQ